MEGIIISAIVLLIMGVFRALTANDIPNKDIYAEGKLFKQNFDRMCTTYGDATLIMKDAAINWLGNPNSISSLGNKRTLIQWQRTGYHLCIIFDQIDFLEKISSEYCGWY